MKKNLKQLTTELKNPLTLVWIFVLFFLLILSTSNPGVVDDGEGVGRANIVSKVLGVSAAALIGYLLISVGMLTIPVPGLNVVGLVLVGIGAILIGGSLAGAYVFLKNNLLIVIIVVVVLLFLKYQFNKGKSMRARRSAMTMQRRPEVHNHHYYINNEGLKKK